MKSLWIVMCSGDGKDWRPSIHDWNWYRVAETKAEAVLMASQARRFVGPSLRYRVVRYVPVQKIGGGE